MCRIYAGQDPANYQPITRSVRISGATTSIRLEAAFWAILDELAAGEGTTTGRFVTTLYNEVLQIHGDVRNFASLLRVTCLLYLESHPELRSGPRGRPDRSRADAFTDAAAPM